MKCAVEGCERDVRYSSLCGMHYKRKWRHGDVHANFTPPLKPKTICSVDGCEVLTTRDDKMCERHAQMLQRYGRTHNIVNRGSGYSYSAFGYVVLYIDGQYIYEHRHLAEKALGRPLLEGVVVHHTGEPHDNYGPWKLVICPSQDYHLLLHRRARELGYENN